MSAPPHDWGVLSFLLGHFSALKRPNPAIATLPGQDRRVPENTYDPVRSNAALSPFASPTASPYAQKCMKTSCGSLSSR